MTKLYARTLALIEFLAIGMICHGAPMGPPSNPTLISVSDKSQELINSGATQGKLATEAIHNQILAANGLQAQQLALAGNQLQELTNAGLQQQKLVKDTVQRQLLTAYTQQQQLSAATVQAQKMAAEALHKQILSLIEFQQKLLSAGIQMPQMAINSVQQPLSASLATASSPMAAMPSLDNLQALAELLPLLKPQPANPPSMAPMMFGLDKMVALPFSLFSPLLTAATSAMAGIPGVSLNSGK